jgi:type I restriction enzyme R subunit
MRKQRQYRGGYEFTGLRQLVRDLRQQQTTAEALLWELLRNRRLRGFKFRRQHQIGRYVADFYCREAQLVIECDGSVHDAKEQWQHDHDRDVYLARQGIRILRFSNDRILNETETIIEEVANCLPLAL